MSPGIAHAMEKIPVLGSIIRVVTFERYEFEDDRHYAHVEIPKVESESEPADEGMSQMNDKQQDMDPAISDSTNKINREITDYTASILNDFKSSLDEDTVKSLNIDYEVVTDTDTWFTLRLNILEIQGSGYQQSKYYHIDKITGRQVTLADLFEEDTEYITIISENIKGQMRKQMEADEGKVYFLEGNDMSGGYFDTIEADQDFYFNENGEIVIEFDEYEVAPGYMGIVSFTIPKSVTEALLKR